MKIKWLGHACFLITSASGIRIITDPYHIREALTYGEIKESADIVTVSHEHLDHNNAEAIRGNPVAVRQSTKAKGIEFKAIPAYHDNQQGKSGRGTNTIFCFTVDGVRVCHLGDLGQVLTDKQIAEIGAVDVLLSPMAGNYTIDAAVATQHLERIKPKVTIPMHFRNEKCSFPITDVDEFLKEKPNVTRLNTSEVEYKPETLPATSQIIVLKPAL